MQRKRNLTQLASQMTALVASLIILTQIGIILFKGKGICLNDGCEIVEQLTKVSPLFFNLAGLLFFQTVFWVQRLTRDDSSRLRQLGKILLLAGLGAEAVLLGFQHFIAETFCSYCLIIFGFILLLNLFAGTRQFITGVFILSAALLAFSSLEFNQDATSGLSINEGIFATKPGRSQTETGHLFFSSSCAHCEKVIETLKEGNPLTIHFNPIDQINNLEVPGTVFSPQYSSSINRKILTSLGIDEIPIFIINTPDGFTILRGEQAITAYLKSSKANDAPLSSDDYSGYSSTSDPLIPGIVGEDDGCTVSTDCDEGNGQAASKPVP